MLYHGRVLTLLLMRHAKSDWADDTQADHARPLTKRGRSDAARMARLLGAQGLAPQTILASNARRARETVEALAAELSFRGDICFYNDLYQASPALYVGALNKLTQPFSPVLLVGHNPEMEEFLELHCHAQEEMKTASLAQVEFDLADWTSMRPKTKGHLVAVWRPKDE